MSFDYGNWRDEANCAGADVHAFYPLKGDRAIQARLVCRECRVKAECLEWALRHGERYGIWGGLSETERRGLKGAAS